MLRLGNIDNDTLTKIVNGEIDTIVVAAKELAARGMDHSGKFVGFMLADKIFKQLCDERASKQDTK